MECGALLDVFASAGALSEERRVEGKRILVRIVAMLSKMCR
jgi:hypothetical protein